MAIYIPTAFLVPAGDADDVAEMLTEDGFSLRGEPLVLSRLEFRAASAFNGYHDQLLDEWTSEDDVVVVAYIGWTEDEDWMDIDLANAVPVSKFTLPGDDEATIDLDAVVAALKDEGIDAYVEQTGGGCATVLVGEVQEYTYTAPWNGQTVTDWYHPAAVGPGWFEGEGWTRGRAHPNDLFAGPEEEGLQNKYGEWFNDDNPATIEKVVAVVKKALEVTK